MYTNNISCQWYIKAPADQVIEITFLDVDLEIPDSNDECLDTVSVNKLMKIDNTIKINVSGSGYHHWYRLGTIRHSGYHWGTILGTMVAFLCAIKIEISSNFEIFVLFWILKNF